MPTKLDEFNSVSSKAWKQKIQADLKGAPYESLLWHTLEGITVKPFYHFDQDNTILDIDTPKTWKIAQSVFVDSAKIANTIAKNAFSNGAELTTFCADKPFDIKILAKNIASKAVHFSFHFLNQDFNQNILNHFPNASLKLDPINQLVSDGNWFQNKNNDFEQLKTLLKTFPNRKIINISNLQIQNSGANSVQQIAYALAHANEYLNEFGATAASQITFEFAIGYNYFFEIAKLRAFRYLWKKLLENYNATPVAATIITVPSKRNKTLYDYNVNMLRTTNECMSAILGGADIVHNMPYDALYHKSNDFGERIARNQLNILKEESGFDSINASQGSYYIETISLALAEKALAIFKSIEKGGGYIQLLFNGTIQRKIKESAQKEQTLFDNGDLELIGTNILQNEVESMQADLELYPFLKINPRKTLIAPIIAKRLAENTEKERLAKEK